ncbi:hypothetical protein GF351_06075 [Candidatus Woesearchaeota archaeon]|nr:hypothetical protein [Candidatus Woesearchaeota archaeon]
MTVSTKKIKEHVRLAGEYLLNLERANRLIAREDLIRRAMNACVDVDNFLTNPRGTQSEIVGKLSHIMQDITKVIHEFRKIHKEEKREYKYTESEEATLNELYEDMKEARRKAQAELSAEAKEEMITVEKHVQASIRITGNIIKNMDDLHDNLDNMLAIAEGKKPKRGLWNTLRGFNPSYADLAAQAQKHSDRVKDLTQAIVEREREIGGHLESLREHIKAIEK